MRSWLRTNPMFGNVVALLALFVALGGPSYAQGLLASNSVGHKQIKKNAVRAAEIRKNAVGAAEIKRNAVRAGEIRKNAVGTTDVLDGSLLLSDLATDSVDGSKVVDGSVLSAEIGDNTVALADLAADSVDGSKIVDGSVSSADIGDNTVAQADLADDSVNGAKVANGSLAGADVAPGTFLGGGVTVQFAQATVALAEGATGTSYDVHCPAGQVALGGGFRGDATDSEYTVTHSSRPIVSLTNPSAPVDSGTFTGWRATVTNPVGDLPQDATAPGPADGPILPEIWVICAAVP